jgi:hypothetical protein
MKRGYEQGAYAPHPVDNTAAIDFDDHHQPSYRDKALDYLRKKLNTEK